MIAARWVMLLAAAVLTPAAIGGMATDLQPSALRLMVTAIVALLAPVFWPGRAASPARTALLVVAWSTASASVAAITLRLGNPIQPLARIFESCAMLMPILLLTHTVVAALEARLLGRSLDADDAREVAGRTVAMALALLGSLPLWFGPMGELLAGRHAWIVDAVVGMSPLTHLAVASGNDLLRNEWLYRQSNLAALPVTYPELAPLAWSYASLCSMLALSALALRHVRRRMAEAARIGSTQERTP